MKSLGLFSFLFYTSLLFSQGDYSRMIFIDSLTHVPISHSEGVIILNDIDTLKVKTDSNGSMVISQPNSFVINEIILFTKDSTQCMARNKAPNLGYIERIQLYCSLSSDMKEKVVNQAKKDIKACNAQIYVDPYSIIKRISNPDSLFSKYGFRYSSSNEFEYSENQLTWELLVVEYNRIMHEYLNFINGDFWKRELILNLQLE